MNRRYAMARLGATLEGHAELTSRLNLLGTNFEALRRPGESPAQAQAAEVFDRLYGEAALMLSRFEDAVAIPPAENLALEDALRRVEAALASYRQLVIEPASAPRRGTWISFWIGIGLLGGVVFMSRSRP